MANEIAQLSGLALPQSVHATEENYKLVTQDANKYLSRVQLMASGMSALVAQRKMQTGDYALIHNKNSFVNLGNTFDALVLNWRPLAMRFGGEESVISVYDPKSPEFKKIEADAELPGSECAHGTDFLIWLPDHKVFATLFFGSKTARKEVPIVKGMINERVTFNSVEINYKKKTWFGPACGACSTPFDITFTQEELLDRNARFIATETEKPQEQKAEESRPM